jgi:protoheme IX farnesyltransferase
MFKDYYSLTKSGLVYGNLITVIGGFALGAATIGDGINFLVLLATLIGISLVMASGCVFNNIIDRDIDARMDRTKDRALITGKISANKANIFGAILGLLGFLILALFTNFITLCVALFGFFAYVFLYSLWAKRRSIHGALVGSISGATPPVVGYAAASGHLNGGALILFLILVCWQMPHFYAIAIRRAEDYAKGGIPVLPVKRGIRATKFAMLFYMSAFVVAASLLTVFGYEGYTYLAIVVALGLIWFALCIKGFAISDKNATNAAENQTWAKKMFFFSLIVMVTLFITITIGAIV